MKKLILIALVVISFNSYCQTKPLIFKTDKTNFSLNYSKTQESPDTVFVNGKRYLALGVGSHSGVSQYGKWISTQKQVYIVDGTNGRGMRGDYYKDLFDIYLNEEGNKILYIKMYINNILVNTFR